MPYGYTPAGFTFGANGLAAIATLRLNTTQTQNFIPGGVFISCIYYYLAKTGFELVNMSDIQTEI